MFQTHTEEIKKMDKDINDDTFDSFLTIRSLYNFMDKNEKITLDQKKILNKQILILRDMEYFVNNNLRVFEERAFNIYLITKLNYLKKTNIGKIKYFYFRYKDIMIYLGIIIPWILTFLILVYTAYQSKRQADAAWK